ncbi:hypothetical protein GCM10007383_06100 [Arenibacter certesii]|uniref:Resolvase/invertase-type recombinase catalytic domain-containing protein n=2 Tax=Arenibacter certesii TaxID=228955 RepID=A0A918MII7_9FLAO|nr:hypothetical protein GCM10007383_06100 [Arenibacter certesii]
MPKMDFGYVRVSSKTQKLDLQVDALLKAKVLRKNIFSDIVSGVKAERKGLDELIPRLREGDTLIVWKMDRVARSLTHLIKLMEDFNDKGINFKSLQEPFIDTKSPHGKFIFAIFAAFAQFERDLIIERTRAGLESSRRKGIRLGRKPGLGEEAIYKAILAENYYRKYDLSVEDIMKLIEVRSKRTLYKYLAYRGRRNCAICRSILWDQKQPVDGAFCKTHNKKVFKFINDRCKLDTQIGDLAREMVSDGKFPTKSEKEIFRYLEIKSIAGGIHPIFLELKNEYKRFK